jgi:hypothetical protein
MDDIQIEYEEEDLVSISPSTRGISGGGVDEEVKMKALVLVNITGWRSS